MWWEAGAYMDGLCLTDVMSSRQKTDLPSMIRRGSRGKIGPFMRELGLRLVRKERGLVLY
jgi:hypothetical protein